MSRCLICGAPLDGRLRFPGRYAVSFGEVLGRRGYACPDCADALQRLCEAILGAPSVANREMIELLAGQAPTVRKLLIWSSDGHPVQRPRACPMSCPGQHDPGVDREHRARPVDPGNIEAVDAREAALADDDGPGPGGAQ